VAEPSIVAPAREAPVALCEDGAGEVVEVDGAAGVSASPASWAAPSVTAPAAVWPVGCPPADCATVASVACACASVVPEAVVAWPAAVASA
jgi:hypothetical protein